MERAITFQLFFFGSIVTTSGGYTQTPVRALVISSIFEF